MIREQVFGLAVLMQVLTVCGEFVPPPVTNRMDRLRFQILEDVEQVRSGVFSLDYRRGIVRLAEEDVFAEFAKTAAECRAMGKAPVVAPESADNADSLRHQVFGAMAFGAEGVDLSGVKADESIQADIKADLRALDVHFMRYRTVATHLLAGGKALDVGGFGDVVASAGERLLVGEMATRDGRGEALFVMNASDPSGRRPSVARVSFRAKGLVEAFGTDGYVDLAKSLDGRYDLRLPSNRAVLIRALPMRFPVLGWWSFPAADVSAARYAEAREAGFTALMQFGEKDRNLAMLDMAAEAGIQLQLSVPWQGKRPDETVEMCKRHPALWTWHVTDEPHARLWQQIGAATERIRTLDARHGCYVNMNPLEPEESVRARYLGVDDYREYLNRALDEMHLPFVSYDSYACYTDTNTAVPKIMLPEPWRVKANWFENLEAAREVAMKRHVPLWMFARATAMHFGGDRIVPTKSSLRLEVYGSLAYGAKVIQYFSYYTPTFREPLQFHEGCVRQDGKRGIAYDLVRAMNRELHARFDRLVGAESIGVWHTGEIPRGTKRLESLPSFVKSLKTDGAIVALLRQGRYDVLMVVNRSPNDDMLLEIELDRGVRRVLEDGAVVDAERYGTIYRLEPGYAEIFIAKKTTKRSAHDE